MQLPEPGALLEAIDIHADALKRAALAAGPATPVPNCPKWTIQHLVTHVAWVHCFAVGTARGHRAEPAPPEDWPDLLGWWDGQRLALREALSRNPRQPARSPFPGFPLTVGDWTRRMAHETAIHRLDAESACPQPPATRFTRTFATDGIAEFLTFLLPRWNAKPQAPVHITILEADPAEQPHTPEPHALAARTPALHTPAARTPEPAQAPPTAAGHTWTFGPAGPPAVELRGAPDDVYRALWGRPHHAEVLGDPALLAPLAAP